MKYEAIIKNENGEVINTFQGETANTDTYYSNVPKDFKFPRVFRVSKSVEGNEDFYLQLLPHEGKTFRIESDQINGAFNVSLDNDEIVLKEVL
jgi:hypothetical protein